MHAAQGADGAVVVVGLTSRDEGGASLALDEDAFGVFGGAFRRRPVRRLVSTLFGLLPDSRKIGGDRRDLHLPAAHVEVVQAVAAADPRTVVVVLLAWYPAAWRGPRAGRRPAR